MLSDIRKVVYALYSFILFSFFYLLCFTCERKSIIQEYSTVSHRQNDSASLEKKIEKPKIEFILNLKSIDNSFCIKDSLIITDTVKSFTKKICYWGDGDSTIYSANQTQLSHKYSTAGIKIIQLVCDTYNPSSDQISVFCDKPDSLFYSIHPLNKPNISQDTLRFNKDLELYFESIDEDTKWIIDGWSYKANTQITFKRHRTIEITYIPGKTYNDCICDSTMKLTFVRR